jgi:hypothetical protein
MLWGSHHEKWIHVNGDSDTPPVEKRRIFRHHPPHKPMKRTGSLAFEQYLPAVFAGDSRQSRFDRPHHLDRLSQDVVLLPQTAAGLPKRTSKRFGLPFIATRYLELYYP